MFDTFPIREQLHAWDLRRHTGTFSTKPIYSVIVSPNEIHVAFISKLRQGEFGLDALRYIEHSKTNISL